jgi:hypothetical protein
MSGGQGVILKPGKPGRIRLNRSQYELIGDKAYFICNWDGPDEAFDLTADHEFFPIGGWPFLELVPEALIDMFGDNLTGGSMRHDRDQSWGEREFQELVFAVTVDEQFRIIIPLRAREHIKLGPDDEITIVWRGSFLEIWRSADYKAAKEAYYKGH